MKIAVINEVSTKEINHEVMESLSLFGHEVINAGMKNTEGENELTYLETGLITALLINTNAVDFVVGGCGTGQGYFNSAMQYPNVFCGLISEPLDALLFAKINGGNCISLAMRKGYGWAGNENLTMIFDTLFKAEFGCGYPESRAASQQQSRKRLMGISKSTHYDMSEIITKLDPQIVKRAIGFDGIYELIKAQAEKGNESAAKIIENYNQTTN